MTRIKDLAEALAASVCIVAIATPSAAQSQSQSQSQMRRYDIAPGPLRPALDSFGRQSGQSVIYRVADVQGKLTLGARGSFTSEEALRRLLAQTGLRQVVGATGAYAITVGNAPAGVDGSATRAAGAKVLSGVVVDEQGAALKGALVEIPSLDRSASTDDLGQFRFPGLAPGDYEVTVAYLGFQHRTLTISTSGVGDQARIQLVGGVADIVVYGQRSARAQALNQERTAENVTTVLSSDQLGNLVGTTLSESLRRVSGVAFERDPATGDGTNIIVRGLAPDFNKVKLNGVELPEGTGNGRTASLGNVLTESVGKVTISKTLLPDQDSSGTGGLVEIETKTPFDRPRRFASFSVEGARRAKHFNNEFNASGTVSATFGADDQFGLSASIQYRDREVRQANYRADLQYPFILPLQVDGTLIGPAPVFNPDGIDPRRSFPFETESPEVYPTNLSINRAQSKTKNLGLSLAAAWAPFEGTKLFFDYQKLKATSTSYSLAWNLRPTIGYIRAPVGAFDGETRRSITWRFGNEFTMNPVYNYSPDAKTSTDVFALRGSTKVGRLALDYRAGYADGTTSSHNYNLTLFRTGNIDPSFLLPEATNLVEGRVVSPYAPRNAGENSFVFPLLNQSGIDFVNDPSGMAFNLANEEKVKGSNRRLNSDIRARYEFSDGILKYIEIGTSWDWSKFRGSVSNGGTNFLRDGSAPTVADLGLPMGESSLGDVGIQSNISVINQAAMIDFLQSGIFNAPGISATPFESDPRGRKRFTKEQELVGYAQGRADIGKMEVIGGARLSRILIDQVNLAGPQLIDAAGNFDRAFFEANSGLQAEHVTQTQLLPRMLANYRFNNHLVARLGYYLSVARPQIAYMSNTISVTLDQQPTHGPANNLAQLTVTKGNPNLKPARTHNFDASLELYSEDIGVLKIGAFYKKINNFLEYNSSGGVGRLDDSLQVLPSDPRFQDVVRNPANYNVLVFIPTNSRDAARIWGIEGSIERKLTFLPGPLNGLGIFANYTFTDSAKRQPVRWNNSPIRDGAGNVIGLEEVDLSVSDQPFTGQARHSGTIAATYSKHGIDAWLGYTIQSRRQLGYGNFNMAPYEEAYGTLDLRMEYRFKYGSGNFRVYFEGSDLLRGVQDPGYETTRGADDGVTSKYYDSARYYGGRQLRLGIATSL